jgi:hypothetical protein
VPSPVPAQDISQNSGSTDRVHLRCLQDALCNTDYLYYSIRIIRFREISTIYLKVYSTAFLWQFKLATWLRVYNYVKNKHVRAEIVAYLVVVSSR